MKKIVLILVAFFIANIVQAQDKNAQNMNDWRYEIECAGIAKEGGALVKVYTYSKNRKVALEEAKRSAVHGILFKGFIGKDGCATQKPMIKNPSAETENKDFFNVFFEEGGKYMKYVTLSTDSNVDLKSIVKTGKEYKIGVIVTVAKDALRKDMEAAGILKNIADRY
jgi:hypothetical protein